MSRFTSFDGLPLIVHDRILRSLPSPEDVANTIRASPGCLHAFKTGRRSILLSAMQNFLGAENQHLMNLVMAAPHYYKHGQVASKVAHWTLFLEFQLLILQLESKLATSTCVEIDDMAAFDKALRRLVVDNSELRPLTPKTFDCSIKIYAIMNKTIKGYKLFTLARSQCRVPMLSTPEACNTRYTKLDDSFWPLDEAETSRIWRGFLLFELLCLMGGMPSIMAAAAGKRYKISKELFEARDLFSQMATYAQEEVLCVEHYVREQYDLAVNALVESFELAVCELGRRASRASASFVPDGIEPIINVGGDQVEFFDLKYYKFHSKWTASMSLLGVCFLQRFLSWDSSTRLDFTRITYLVMNRLGLPTCIFPQLDISFHELVEENFGWSNHEHRMDRPDWMIEWDNACRLRLRAVGWIFWKRPDRLDFMHLTENRVAEKYTTEGIVYRHLRLKGRPHLMELLVDVQEWKRIVDHFNPHYLSKRQLSDIKALFTSIETLDSSSIAHTVSAWRCHGKEEAPTEVTEGDN